MPKVYDVIVIGAGLAGLSAAINLQQAGYKVLLLEKNSRAGGLCGTFKLNNYEFVIACNDFCGKVINIFKAFGVETEFCKSRMRFYMKDTIIDIPPTFNTIYQLFKNVPDLVRLFLHLKKGILPNETLETLGNRCRNQTLSEFVKSFSYPFGMVPEDILIMQLKEEFSKQYQYKSETTYAPVHGPAAMVEGLLKKYYDLGGELHLNTICLDIHTKKEEKQIETSKGCYRAARVINSQFRYDLYPNNFKPGLAISKFCVVVKKSCVFPKGYHTIIYFPENLTNWLSQIDQCKQPVEFGFHFFPSPVHLANDYYCINIYFYLPRGLNNPSFQQIATAKNYIFKKIEDILPGFLNAIIYSKFISVGDFQSRHDLSSVVSPIIDPHFIKPDNYDKEKDIYYIGNSVYPPGNHAGAAMLSAMIVAEQVKERDK